MPTPFTHLATADEILSAPDLAPEVHQALSAELPAFLLGTIAPDVQTLSGQLREDTHFFPVPLDGCPPAPRSLLERYPGLSHPASLRPAQAAFLAGYLTHLVFDQLWVAEIFEPAFGPQQTWGSFRERLYLHNVLRAHWDGLDLARLQPGTAERLYRATPEAWIPFVEDRHLYAWRDLVADQLGSGEARTVEVFAQRMKADPAQFAGLLASPEELNRRLFVHLPQEALSAYRARALACSVAALQSFWQGDRHFHQL